MTVAKLMQNTFESAKRHFEAGRARKVTINKLNMLEKVPRFVLPLLLVTQLVLGLVLTSR